MNIFARVFSKCAVKTNSNTKSPDPPSQSTASVVSAWYLYMASKYFIHRVSLKVILCSNSLLRHYCVEAGILSPSSSKQCTMPLFFFPPLVALMQHSCSPTMKCVSVPSSTNSPCGTVQKTLRSFRIPAAVQSFTGGKCELFTSQNGIRGRVSLSKQIVSFKLYFERNSSEDRNTCVNTGQHLNIL